MSDKSLGGYYIYSLRSEFPKTRIEFIEYCLKKSCVNKTKNFLNIIFLIK